MSKKKIIHYTVLENWKERRKDKKTEEYWKKIEKERPLTSFEKYQQEWNYREIDYSYRPSNNGLDFMNPGFAFDTKLAKYLVIKQMEIDTI